MNKQNIQFLNEKEEKYPLAIINTMIVNLLLDSVKNIYGNLLQLFNFKFIKNGENVPEIDIMLEVKNKNFTFIINPIQLFSKNKQEIEARIIHELEHFIRKDFLEPKDNAKIISFHENKGKKIKYAKTHCLKEIAMDLAINSLKFKYKNDNFYSSDEESIDYLLKEGIFPSTYPFEKYPAYQSWEWYYNQLKNDIESGKIPSFSVKENNEIHFNSNSTNINIGNNDWDIEVDNENEILEIKTEVNRQVCEAIRKTKSAGGKVPDHIEQYIEELKKIPYDWKTVLSTFIYSTITPDTRFSKRKISRRAITKNCFSRGVIRTTALKIWVFIDVSGSISTSEFENSINHIKVIKETVNIEMRVTTFDDQIEFDGILNEYNYKKILKTKIPHTKGGTLFTPIYELFEKEKNKFNPDLVIIFTDGYFFDTVKKLKVKQFLWVLTENNPNENISNFGKKIIMKKYY